MKNSTCESIQSLQFKPIYTIQYVKRSRSMTQNLPVDLSLSVVQRLHSITLTIALTQHLCSRAKKSCLEKSAFFAKSQTFRNKCTKQVTEEIGQTEQRKKIWNTLSVLERGKILSKSEFLLPTLSSSVSFFGHNNYSYVSLDQSNFCQGANNMKNLVL